MNFKRYVESSDTWVDTPHYIHNTSTDTITTLPADIYANDTTATVGLKGNTVQSGTPTPDSPIMPEGTGERTGNLVRFYQEEMQGNFYGVDITVKNAEITLNGTVSSGSGHWVEIGYKFGGGTETTDAVVIPCEPETTYTITIAILGGNSSEVRFIAFGTADGNKTVNIGSSLTTVFSGDINRIFISLGAEGVVFNNLKIRVMFNKGSTVIPYEPYGYKIPISSANTTTPVYLGEVQTTRQVKKVVLTGQERWTLETRTTYQCVVDMPLTGYVDSLSTHYQMAGSYVDLINTNNTFALSKRPALFINDNRFSTTADFKSYLAQQYANGTPVCVWYVLATPTTGIVNEPLMKIGNYADSLTTSIPCTAGENSFDVDTTVAPSEVTANYQGWHPVQSAHEYDYLLASNPLCGITTYKDELNLATGACARRIRKLILTGEETIDTFTVTDQLLFRFNTYYTRDKLIGNADDTLLCNVYKIAKGRNTAALAENNYSMTTYNSNTDNRLLVHDNRFTTETDFKAYLAQQYAAGTPVTVWYVLSEPTTETITVPSGLSGIEEGYLNQRGTPTPTNPIYPTANEVKVWT